MDGPTAITGRKTADTLRDMVPALDAERIERVLRRAKELYGDRTMELMPGMTLYAHALETVEFLAEFCPDEDALVACILQHSLKIPDMSLADLGREFGRPVRDSVSRIHLLSHLYTTDWRKSVDDMKIMLVSVADDVRVLLIALAGACIYLKDLDRVRPDFRARLCRQSLQLFAPVAARLGMYALKYRLERSAFPECYPTDAQHIGLQLKRVHTEHGDFLNVTAGKVRDFLQKQGIEADVRAREKQPYSVFQKMRSKSVTSLEKITDLFAIRVVVPSISECYQALGFLHQFATPISHRFKDYISFPKPNGYQSLHTCLIGLPGAPKDVMVEVQIRTQDMHREAEYGIAAHWMYKDGSNKSMIQRSAEKMQLSDVLLKQQSVDSDDTSPDETALADHIYVLTPRGDIIELPEGGTPLDFAFALHTDIGLKYKAARVNGNVVPISYDLGNGDVVEILMHKTPRPTLQWLEVLVTPSARSKLKNYFFAHNRPQFLQKGKDLVNAELRARGQQTLDADFGILSTFDGESLTPKQREDLLVKVGMGSVRTSSVLRHAPPGTIARRGIQPKKKTTRAASPKELVAIVGQTLKMPYRFAKCCAPQEMSPRPETIVGIVTRNGVVNVHKHNCRMAKGGNPERKLRMYWVK